MISEDSRIHVSTLTGVDDYKRASELTMCIQNILKSHSNPTEYLTQVCYALFELENEGLNPILISILDELEQPLPPGIYIYIYIVFNSIDAEYSFLHSIGIIRKVHKRQRTDDAAHKGIMIHQVPHY